MAMTQQRWIERCAAWPTPVVVAGALVAGVAWGALARAWMRIISTDPEFTVSGSVFIAGAFGAAATCQSLALVARRHPSTWVKRAARAVGIVGMFPLFIGAGATMLPTVVGGGLALGQREWPRSLRLLVAALAAVPVLAVSASLVADFGFGLRLLVGVVGLLVLYGGVVVATSTSLGPAPDARPLPRPLRLAVVVAIPAVLFLGIVGIAGLRGS